MMSPARRTVDTKLVCGGGERVGGGTILADGAAGGAVEGLRGEELEVLGRVDDFAATGNEQLPGLQQRDQHGENLQRGQIDVLDHDPASLAHRLQRRTAEEREQIAH